MFFHYICTNKVKKMRKIRIAIATLFFVGTTLLFLDVTGYINLWFGWMAKIQFVPALLALNFVVVAAVALLTLLFGRIYCSVICPLGIMQDIISWFSGKRKGKKLRFGYKKERKWLRYAVLVLFFALLIAGINSIAILVAPYSAYGRIATNLFAPVYDCGNNILAFLSEKADGYTFYRADSPVWTLPTFLIALVTFIVVFVLAWRGGRSWCNNICPVGTLLGLLSRISIFRPVIDTEKCVNCGKCGKKCKGSCIDTANHKIDYSRCVACFDCLDNCSTKAISFSAKRGGNHKSSETPADPSRRSALTVIGLAASAITLKAQEQAGEGGLAVLEDKKIPAREVKPKPAGSGSIKHFNQHCTGCQLCVASCPNRVLRPSTDLSTLMQPEMSFEKGACRPECTRCSEVCPTGAIKKITVEEKSSIQIGHAVFIPENCVVTTDNVRCGNCARHCPTSAIKLVENKPSIDVERCIGCGECEYVCPVRPLSAIYVEGHLVHKEI